MNLMAPIRWCEEKVQYAAFFVVSRGDRAAASEIVADSVSAIGMVTSASAGRIRKKSEYVWDEAGGALGFRAMAWFLISAFIGVGGVFLPRDAFFGYLTITVASVPTALFASRQLAHQVVRKALVRGRLTPRAQLWLPRWLSGGFVALLALPAWGVWAAVIQPWS